MGPRHDMYRNVHKGLRRTLCALVADAGSADASSATLRVIVARWQETSKLLAAHHHHEDTFIGPHLQRIAPSLLARMEQDHQALEQATRALDLGAAELTTCAAGELAETGLRFYRQLASFVGHYLCHLADEDGPYLRALQDAYDDAQLAAIEGALLASMPAETMGAFLSVMLPAMNTGERIELLAGIRENAPPPVFAGTFQLAQQVLDAAAFRALQAGLFPAEQAVLHA